MPSPIKRTSYLNKTSLSLLSLRIRVCHPNTRIYVRLLGPCFKTGRLEPFRQHPKRWCDSTDRAPYSDGQSASCLNTKFKRRSGTQKTLQTSVQPEALPEAITLKPKPELPSTGFLPQAKLMLTCQQASAPHAALSGRAADYLQAILVPSVSLLAISRTV